MSDIFKNGIIFQGDCLDIMDKLIENDVKVDLTVTSPPYDNLRNYNNTCNWNFDIFKKIADKLYSITKEGGVIIWVVGDKTEKGSESGTSFKQALYFKEIGFNLHDTMLYRKINYIPLTHNRYEQEFEYMFCFSKGKPNVFNPIKIDCKNKGNKQNGSYYKTDSDSLTRVSYTVKDKKIKGNIFEYAVGGSVTGKYKHPAMFPYDLAKDQIISWTNENQLILDPFMWSGTTCVACQNLNRNFIGIELEGKYYNIARDRIKENEK